MTKQKESCAHFIIIKKCFGFALAYYCIIIKHNSSLPALKIVFFSSLCCTLRHLHPVLKEKNNLCYFWRIKAFIISTSITRLFQFNKTKTDSSTCSVSKICAVFKCSTAGLSYCHLSWRLLLDLLYKSDKKVWLIWMKNIFSNLHLLWLWFHNSYFVFLCRTRWIRTKSQWRSIRTKRW